MTTNLNNVNAVRQSVLALALGVACALPAMAQPAGNGTGTGTTTTSGTGAATDAGTVRRDRDDGFDWGWLGLLGLAGLAGLRRQPHAQETHRAGTTATR